MFAPRKIVTFEASMQPGVGRQPTKLESAAGHAVSRTTVPTGNLAVHVPEPLPATSVQLMPAG